MKIEEEEEEGNMGYLERGFLRGVLVNYKERKEK